MGIKPDHWIRRMANDYKMIEPFVESSVRNGVISYGVSSYGYDIRVSNEFKVFTNVNSAVVDPKNFVPQSFIDVVAEEYCIIPPNSFVLSRTVEYFRIPREVLTICIGKSTYARCGLIVNVTPLEPCFSADTEILTPSGWKCLSGIRLGDRVMGMDDHGFAQYQPVLAKQAYDFTGNLMHFGGRSIDLLVTPDHKLLVNRRTNGRSTRHGPEKTGWHTAEATKVFGAHNYEMTREVRWVGRDPGPSVWINGDCYPTAAFLRFLGLWLGDGSAYPAQKAGKASGYVVQIAAFNHKRDYVRQVLDELGVTYSSMREGFRFYKKSLCDYLQQYKLAQNKHVPREWFDLTPDLIRSILEGLLVADGNIQTQTITTVSPQLADDIQTLAYLSGRSAIVRQAKADDRPRVLNGNLVRSNYPVYKVRLSSHHLTPKIRPERHQLVPYSGKVYDVTVPNHLIFVRRNGKAVWSGNCWEGYLTLEISNTTPLPAKVYANEGIAQLLFLAGDGICEQSYKDKKGKYQGQVGVTLPRIESEPAVEKTDKKKRKKSK